MLITYHSSGVGRVSVEILTTSDGVCSDKGVECTPSSGLDFLHVEVFSLAVSADLTQLQVAVVAREAMQLVLGGGGQGIICGV